MDRPEAAGRSLKAIGYMLIAVAAFSAITSRASGEEGRLPV